MNQSKLSLAAALAAIVMAIGCGNPCDDFDCAACNEDVKAGCEALVLVNNSDACQDVIDADGFPSCR